MKNNNRKIDSPAGLDRAVYEVCNILRRDKAKGARLYVPELTWMLFLCALDAKESEEEQRAAAVGQSFSPTIVQPYRWRDWAATFDRRAPLSEAVERQLPGWKRQELVEAGSDHFLHFVNKELFPHLRSLREIGGTTNRQKVVGEIFASKEVSERSWYELASDIKARDYDLKATNPNAPDTTDKRTPEELLQIIEEAQHEISQAAKNLREQLEASIT